MSESAPTPRRERVIVGMSNDAFSQRQQEILFKAGILALLFGLLLSHLGGFEQLQHAQYAVHRCT